jgi:group I intron endonuclease
MGLTPRITENTEKVIYKATSPSGKAYIGKTVRSLKHRKMMHYATVNSVNTPFSNALKKYGTNIKWEILAHCRADKELRAKEIELIKKHDTYNSGYNCTIGGEGHAGFKQSEETIKKRVKKIKKALTGRKLSDAHKKALSESHKGLPSNRKGKKCSEETKQKISKYQDTNKKPIVCLDTGEIFEHSRQAAKAVRADRGNLMKHLKGVKSYKTIKGYKFQYLEVING